MPRSRSALTYVKWREQYGPLAWAVVTGTQYLIVNDYEMIKELFEKKGNIYLNRPEQNIMLAEIGAFDLIRRVLSTLVLEGCQRSQ